MPHHQTEQKLNRFHDAAPDKTKQMEYKSVCFNRFRYFPPAEYPRDPRLPAPALPSTVMRRQGPITQSPPPNSPGHTAIGKQRNNLVCIPSLYHYQEQFEAMSVTGLIVRQREI